MKCHFIAVAWGETFRHYLCSVCLPSLLAPGNLPAWPYLATSKFRLFMPATDWQAIQKTPILQQIQQWIAVEWCPVNEENLLLPSDTQMAKYSYRGMLLAEALHVAETEQAAVLILIPDMVYTQSFLHTLATEIKAGKQAVFHWGPRLVSKILDVLAPWSHEQVISLPAEAAVTMMILGLHADCQAYEWLHPVMNTGNPRTVLYWKDSDTYACQTLMADPLFLLHPKPFLPYQGDWGSLDDRYLSQYDDLLQQPEKVALFGSGDSLAFSVMPSQQMPLAQHHYKPIPVVWRARAIYEQIRQHGLGALHRWLFQQELIFKRPKNCPPPEMTTVAAYQPWVQLAPWQVAVLVAHIAMLYSQQQPMAIRLLWQNPTHKRGLVHLKDPVLYPVFYWIAWALVMTGEWAEGVAFIRQYHSFLTEAYFELGKDWPIYTAYWPQPPGYQATESVYSLLITVDVPFVVESGTVVLAEFPEKGAFNIHELPVDRIYALIYGCERLFIGHEIRLNYFEMLLYAVLLDKPVQFTGTV